jgi:hypothetical protein
MALGLDETNFRQAGTGRAGQILRGGTAGQLGRSLPGALPPATIPSKYETVLFGAPKEREGFGSQTSRFGAELVNDNPGPGAYLAPGSTVLWDAPSIGKRGYGNGFASRTKRDDRVPATHRTPGPGNYEVQKYKATGSDARAVQRPFAQPKGGRALRPDGADGTTPGPGSYNLGRHLDVHAPEQGYAAPTIGGGRVDQGAGERHGGHRFSASQAPRFRSVSAYDIRPGPGAYDTASAQVRHCPM